MKFGIRLVQRWQIRHDCSKTTEFRAVPFRGDKLDMTVQKGNLVVYRFRGDELDMIN